MISHIDAEYGSIQIQSMGNGATSKPKNTSKFIIGIIFAVIVSFGVVINESYNNTFTNYLLSRNDFSKTKSSDSTDADASTEAMPSWTIYRKGYEPLPYFTSEASNFLKYKFLEKYIGVIEPYAEMYLYVEGFQTDDDTDGSHSPHYEITLCRDGSECVGGSIHKSSSVAFKVECEPFWDYNVSVVEKTSGGELTGVYDLGLAKCMYVRREIRDLSEDDLESTMDAMATLWYTNEDEGRVLYGDNFHNSTYLASAHYFGAGQQDADHIHEGLGFLLQHIKLTNIFELSIQAVDPSISLPYWDFTIDQAEKTSAYDMPVFQENMFGSLTPPNDDEWGWTYAKNSVDDARIPNGRWANVKSEYNIWYPTLRNGYGYLRAPWNMNPSPYITRFISAHDFPGCSSYLTWLKKSDLMMFLKYSPGPPHAAVHGNIGGSFGCDYLDWMTDAGYLTASRQKALCSKWGFKLKDLYRLNFIAPKKDCVQSDEVNDSLCGFDCVTSRMGGMISAMNDSMSMYFGTDFPTKHWTAVRDFICTGDGYKVFFGDHLESASAADPSFWPIHPTMERAMQAKFMAGGFETSEWYTDYQEEWICGRNECYEGDVDAGKGYYPKCCFGHYRDDGLIDFVSGNVSRSIGLTNAEVIEYTDPTNSEYGMTYIYADFAWDHCDKEDLNGFLEDLHWGEVTLADDDSVFDLTDPLSFMSTDYR